MVKLGRPRCVASPPASLLPHKGRHTPLLTLEVESPIKFKGKPLYGPSASVVQPTLPGLPSKQVSPWTPQEAAWGPSSRLEDSPACVSVSPESCPQGGGRGATRGGAGHPRRHPPTHAALSPAREDDPGPGTAGRVPGRWGTSAGKVSRAGDQEGLEEGEGAPPPSPERACPHGLAYLAKAPRIPCTRPPRRRASSHP